MPLEQSKMQTREHASKIENSPGMMCETVPQATSWQIQEVDVGWDVYCRESMLTVILTFGILYASYASNYSQRV